MSNVIDGLLYTETHEWVRVLDSGVVEVGITAHAQDQLGDIVFLELPAVGDAFDKGDAIGVVESVKTVSDVYTPFGGEITEVNDDLADTPELVNEAPFEGGWLFRLAASDVEGDQAGLMDAAAYRAAIGE